MASNVVSVLLGLTAAVCGEAPQSLWNRGCRQKTVQYGPLSYGEQWECPNEDGTPINVAYFDAKASNSGGFPVVATHQAGLGGECALYAAGCSSCVPRQGCIWAANKCVSDSSCRGEPASYCADGVTQTCDRLVAHASRASVGRGYSFLVKNHVEIPVRQDGTFNWPPQHTFAPKPQYSFARSAVESNPFATVATVTNSAAVEAWLSSSVSPQYGLNPSPAPQLIRDTQYQFTSGGDW